MRRFTVDGFALRFPRTGIVNYIYNTLFELSERGEFDLTILLEDLSFADAEIAAFVRTSLNVRIVEKFVETDTISRVTEYFRNRNLPVRLPTAKEVRRCVAPGDIYHATDWYHYAAPHARLNILTCHDLTAKLYPQFHERASLVKESRKAKALRDFDHIFANSNSTRNDLINHLNVSPKKVSTSYHAVNRIYDSPTLLPRDVLLSKYRIDPSRRYILSVSTIEPRKNIIGILNAYKTLCAEHPAFKDVYLVLSGQMGWLNDSLNEFMASYPNRENIVFTGYVALEDMPSLYHHAEAFIYLSFYEGFGVPILEAMKSSCPVVCSNTSSMPEVLGDSGELVSPDSPDEAAAALARILNDCCYADSLRFAGFVRSKSFSWAKHVEEVVQFCNAS